MREMNIDDVAKLRNSKRKQIKMITTPSSKIPRSEDEMIMLMKSVRNRFKKAVEEGRIEIISKYEWRLH